MTLIEALRNRMSPDEARAVIVEGAIESEFLNRALPIAVLVSLFHDNLSELMSDEAKAMAVGIYLTNLLDHEVEDDDDEAEV